MLKSEIYHLAQIAVVNTPCIAPETKLEILSVLIDDKSVALYCEKKEAEEAAVDAI